MTVELMERDRLGDPTREQLNPVLEAWYNDVEQETPVYVPYHHWLGPRHHEFPPFQGGVDIDLDQIRSATQEAVHEMVEEQLNRPLSEQERDPATTSSSWDWTVWNAWTWHWRSSTGSVFDRIASRKHWVNWVPWRKAC